MSSPRSWICDGVPKDGKQYPNSAGPHSPHENHGPDCLVCGLPEEAMNASKTILSANAGAQQPVSFPVPLLVAIALLILFSAGVGFYLAIPRNKTRVADNNTQPGVTQKNSSGFVSQTAVNARLISEGEKVLLTGGANFQEKTAAAAAFIQQNWDKAIAQYTLASSADRNDPESKIYLNNAKAKKAGKPLTMAVVVPITISPNETKEVLRGVAQYQNEFNQTPTIPNRLLEVVVVNEEESNLAESLAQDLIESPVNVLGVLGHGVDSNSRLALGNYEKKKLAVISPLNTAITNDTGKSTLKTIPSSQTATLLGTYLQKVGQTLANYASENYSPASVAIFYNSDSSYSMQMKDEFVDALSGKGEVVKVVDITSAGFDAAAAIRDARQSGANIAFLAMSKNKVDTAIAIAKANLSEQRLILMGGDELYNPTVLVRGDSAIDKMVLAVPWRWRSDDRFAKQAANLWQGRVSWRTATTYDATQALAIAFSKHPGDRAAIIKFLNSGVTLTKGATEFNLFNDIPLVRAIPGKNGPVGSRYQFDPI